VLHTLRAVLRQEMTPRNKAGALLAVLTCPCHAGMLVIVLAGTAVGSWLAAIQAYLYVGLTIVFALGLWLMVRRSAPACEIPRRAESSKPAD
jgi:cytochrome c biogenesis protein CcdA